MSPPSFQAAVATITSVFHRRPGMTIPVTSGFGSSGAHLPRAVGGFPEDVNRPSRVE